MADQPPSPDADSSSLAGSGPDVGSGSGSSAGSGPGSGDAGEPVESTEPSLGDVVATARDIVLYAPIALVLDAPTLLPKLAEQGKQHMRNARALGPHALRRIQNRLMTIASNTVGEQATELLRQFGVAPGPTDDGASGPSPGGAARSGSRRPGSADGSRAGAASDPATHPRRTADGSENGRGPVPSGPSGLPAAATPPSPAVDELAIPDYDSLSALQVVDRLPGLTSGELEAVRAYEAAHRGRKTILNKAAQLQA